MNARRVTSLFIVVLVAAVVFGQGFSQRTSAAPSVQAQVSAHISANGRSQSPTDQAPYHITVQGRLTTGAGNPITTPVTATFKLYPMGSGGSPVFTETASLSPDNMGLFTYQLGTNSPITTTAVAAFANKLYLGIRVEADAEMTPRLELTASPYAMSLAPGALVEANLPNPTGSSPAILSLINDDQSSFLSTSLFAIAPSGVIGFVSGSGGAGLVGLVTTPYTQSQGMIGIDPAAMSYGVVGTALDLSGPVPTPGDPSAIGLRGESYNEFSSTIGLQVAGKGTATGGFVTGAGYSMMVKYNGTQPLHLGDVLAFDGNNTVVDGDPVIGTVRATADNASAALGIAQHRFTIYTAPAQPAGRHAWHPASDVIQVDAAATTFQPGDLIEIVVVGQAQMKVSGSVNVGDRLALASDGSGMAAKASTDSVARAVSKPDASGLVTVFVNFK